jgi:hypothetical protein
MGVAIGVDSHKSSLAAAALDEFGRVVGGKEFPLCTRAGRPAAIDQASAPKRVEGGSIARGVS